MSPSENRSATRHVIIREFKPGDEGCFRKLNEEWITRYFSIEVKDEEAFVDPQSSILAPGGRIFLATIEDQCIGCCALVRLCADEFEVAKMAVAPMWQGSGIGRKLLQSVVEALMRRGFPTNQSHRGDSPMSPIKMSEELNHNRRRFLRNATLAFAAAELATVADAQSSPTSPARAPAIRERTPHSAR